MEKHTILILTKMAGVDWLFSNIHKPEVTSAARAMSSIKWPLMGDIYDKF